MEYGQAISASTPDPDPDPEVQDEELNYEVLDDEEHEIVFEEEEEEEEESRPSRSRSAPIRLDPTWQGKSYAQVAKEGPKKTTPRISKPALKKIKPLKSVRKVRFADEHKFSTKKESCHNLISQSINPDNKLEYTSKTSLYIARTMCELRKRAHDEGVVFGQQFTLKKGLKEFQERGVTACKKELGQLHKRVVFDPVSVKDMTTSERRKAQESFMFLTEKRDKSVKARLVFNGKPTRDWISKEDSASPTAANESVMITAAIDAYEHRDIMSADVPNAFVQTEMPERKEGEDRVIMKITGPMVDILVELDPQTYSNFVVFERTRKVIYVVVLKAIYGMLVASLLWYQKFRKDLESIDFEFNPYDPCVANRMKNGSQHTIRFHVDDVLSSHVDKRVNDKFLEWLNRNYGKIKDVVATRGQVHDYLGMTLDFNTRGKVKFKMDDYVEKMIESFPVKLKSTDTAMTPASNTLFEEGNSKVLGKHDVEVFHTYIAKCLFLGKRAKPDIQPTA